MKNTPENYGSFKRSMDPKLLRELYVEHTDAVIASRYGVSDAIVSRYRKQWGIRTVSDRERRGLKRKDQGLLCLEDLTPLVLASLYQRMGDRQIALMYGVTKPTISNKRKLWGVAPISKTQRATSLVMLTDEQQEALIGSLLGDGHVTARGAFKVSHSHSQRLYLLHFHELLASLAKPVFFSEKEMLVSGTLTYEYGFWTSPHPWLLHLRKVFYPDGVKVFPEPVMENLSPRSLAYWYFDDGHLDSNLPSFALGDVSVAAAEAVASQIQSRFALKAYRKPTSTPTCQVIGLRARSVDLFCSLVVPFMTDDLWYKVPRKYWPKKTKAVRPRLTRASFSLPKHLRDLSKQWPTLDDLSQDSLLDEWVAFWTSQGFPFHTPKVEDLDVLHHMDGSLALRNGVVRRLHAGQSVCQAHMPHIWDTTPDKAPLSPLALFKDPVHLRKVLALSLKLGRIPNGAQLRSALRLYRYSGVYNFRPAAAKAFVDRFCPPGGTVFDPCGGWGGRLLGTVLSTTLPTYIACEPQPLTFKGLGDLRDWVGRYFPGVPGRVQLHQATAEDFTFPENVDLVMTSPPYWKKEHYGDEDHLAGNRYTTYDSWLTGFLEPVMQKAVRALKQGGWLVLNIDDFKIGAQKYGLIEDCIRIAQKQGLGEPSERYKYDMGKPGDASNHEMVLCWAKGAGALLESPDPSLETPSCRDCSKPVASTESHCVRCTERLESAKKTCEECSSTFRPARGSARFCSQACGARSRRRRKRVLNPVKETRVFQCVACRSQWETTKHGNFKYCPQCKEDKDLAPRRKVCKYRLCGEAFVDTSSKNGMQFCCAGHRGKEKRHRARVPQG